MLLGYDSFTDKEAAVMAAAGPCIGFSVYYYLVTTYDLRTKSLFPHYLVILSSFGIAVVTDNPAVMSGVLILDMMRSCSHMKSLTKSVSFIVFATYMAMWGLVGSAISWSGGNEMAPFLMVSQVVVGAWGMLQKQWMLEGIYEY